MLQKVKAPSSSLVRIGMASTTALKLLLYLFPVQQQEQITVLPSTTTGWRCEPFISALPVLLCSSELLRAQIPKICSESWSHFILTKPI